MSGQDESRRSFETFLHTTFYHSLKVKEAADVDAAYLYWRSNVSTQMYLEWKADKNLSETFSGCSLQHSEPYLDQYINTHN